MNKDKIVFLGDSITQGFHKLAIHENIENMGIGGDKTIEVIGRLNSVTLKKPGKLFLLVGINDYTTNKGKWGDHLRIPFTQSYDLLLNILKTSMPETEFIVQAILPLNVSSIINENEVDQVNNDITELNSQIKELSKKHGMKFIDFTDKFKNEKGHLKEEFTMDGTHLTELGYEEFYNSVKPYL